jgi:glutamate synthase (ferredoxin)
LDLSALLGVMPSETAPLKSSEEPGDNAQQQNGSVGNLWTEIKATKEKTLTERILADPEVLNALRAHGQIERSYEIRNTDRAVGARIAGVIASVHGEHGFRGKISLSFQGAAGQSFGAFLVENMQVSLTGEANDYVGKGMNGGEIVVRPYEGFAWDVRRNIIVGNACLYGATGGTVFAAGQAGERFAVRNSRANAVIEGTGDHCCEYMTGGTIVVLGSVGRNFGAGMTGGKAFVFDGSGSFPELCNIDSGMAVQRLDESNFSELQQLVQRHHQLTGSQTAQTILENWTESVSKFWQVCRNSECSITMLESQTQTDAGAESVLANHQTETAALNS